MADIVIYHQRRRDKRGNLYTASPIARRTPTQSELMQMFRYDPETGLLTRLLERGKGRAGDVARCINKDGYIELRVCNRLFKAHQLAWLYMTGSLPPEGMSVDHINGRRSDNRWKNLRLATRVQQNWNTGVTKVCKSGLKGAWPCKSTGRWQSIITNNGKKMFLGRFSSAEEAHEAYVAAAKKIRGEEWTVRNREGAVS